MEICEKCGGLIFETADPMAGGQRCGCDWEQLFVEAKEKPLTLYSFEMEKTKRIEALSLSYCAAKENSEHKQIILQMLQETHDSTCPAYMPLTKDLKPW